MKRLWTKEEDEVLAREIQAGTRMKVICKILNRTLHSVGYRRRLLGIPARQGLNSRQGLVPDMILAAIEKNGPMDRDSLAIEILRPIGTVCSGISRLRQENLIYIESYRMNPGQKQYRVYFGKGPSFLDAPRPGKRDRSEQKREYAKNRVKKINSIVAEKQRRAAETKRDAFLLSRDGGGAFALMVRQVTG